MVDITSVTDKFFDVGVASSFGKMFLWGFIFIGIISVIIFAIRFKLTYSYRGEIYKRRQNRWDTNEPDTKEIRGWAGYIHTKNGTVFRIRWGIAPWQVLSTKILPNPKYIQDKTVCYIQYDVDELIQAQKTIDWDLGTIQIKPVDSTTKASAKLDFTQWAASLNQKTKWSEYAWIAGMVLVLVAGIVAFYFQTKACGA